MIELITIQEARDHLRIDNYDSDGGPDDNDLQLKIYAATGAVLNYLKSTRNLYEVERDEDGNVLVDSDGEEVLDGDSDGNRTVKPEVKAAVMLMLGYLCKDRDGDPDKAYQPGYLPAPVMSLLYPLRDPALA